MFLFCYQYRAVQFVDEPFRWLHVNVCDTVAHISSYENTCATFIILTNAVRVNPLPNISVNREAMPFSMLLPYCS